MSEKEQAWLSEYFQCWDATEAARRVGYKWPNKLGPRLKKRLGDEIKAYLEDMYMSAEEALARLANQARGDLGDFAGVRTPRDLVDHPQSELVHKLRTRARRDKEGNITVTTEIELYNAQSALQLIGKHHKLFTEQYEHSASEGLQDLLTELKKLG